MVVALPIFNGAVAPCFEAARTFLFADVVESEIIAQATVTARGCEGFGRVQLLRQRRVDVLICNGIKSFYADLLTAAGVAVHSGISGDTGVVLQEFITGKIASKRGVEPSVDLAIDVPLEDLICWTKELFSAHGYRVQPGAEAAPFPIDLIAEIACPVCARPVRVAICCGAHAYRPEQEIQSLQRAAAAGYDAKVYVHTGSTCIEQYCGEFGIELVDPNARFARRDDPDRSHIPILQRPVPGHEKAFTEIDRGEAT